MSILNSSEMCGLLAPSNKNARQDKLKNFVWTNLLHIYIHFLYKSTKSINMEYKLFIENTFWA